MSDKRKGRAGRPTLSESAKKRTKKGYEQQRERQRTGTRIYIRLDPVAATEFERVKQQMRLTTNNVVLKHLLHTYKVHEACSADAGEDAGDDVVLETSVEERSVSPSSEASLLLPGIQHRKQLPSAAVEETRSTSSSEASSVFSFRQPYPPPATSRLLMSTPYKPDTEGASTSTAVPIPEGPTSSISGSGSERELLSSDIEAGKELEISGIGGMLGDTVASNKSGTWNVELHEELAQDITIDEMDETYFPSIPGSTDSLDMDDYEDIVAELLDNLEVDVDAADDEDIADCYREEELEDLDDLNVEEAEVVDEPEQEKTGKSKETDYINVNINEDHTDEKTTIAFASCLKQLAAMETPKTCSKCSSPLTLEESQTGTALYLKWVCNSEDHQKHVERQWCSQPKFKYGATLGDFITSCAILFSGNQYAKIAVFLNALNMKTMHPNLFYKVTSFFGNPAVDQYWLNLQQEVLQECGGQDVVALGDGRMDSPGFSAEYCTYTTVDNATKNILDVTIVNKRETGLNSVTMEREGCRKALNTMQEKGLQVVELATDAHTQISAMMAREFEGILHSLDVWHGAKNLGKRLAKAGLEAGCKPLLPWIRDIVTHFWHCIKVTSTHEEFVEKWRGTIHHVVNKHEWFGCQNDSNPSGVMQCDHDVLEVAREGKDWLEEGSPAHKKVRELVLDAKLLKNVVKFLRFRNTSVIENFNSIILSYAPKRISYRPPAYKARCLLAAIDYQKNKDRALAVNKDGQLRLQRRYNKRTKRYDAYPVKVAKTYKFIGDLMQMAVKQRIMNPHLMKQKVTLDPNDPRNIMPRLTIEEPEPTRTLYEKKMTRM